MQPDPQTLTLNSAIQAAVLAGFGGSSPPPVTSEALGGLIASLRATMTSRFFLVQSNEFITDTQYTLQGAIDSAHGQLAHMMTYPKKRVRLEIFEMLRLPDGRIATVTRPG